MLILITQSTLSFPHYLAIAGTTDSHLTKELFSELTNSKEVLKPNNEKTKHGLLPDIVIEIVEVKESKYGYSYINPSQRLPSGNLIARRINGDPSTADHQSDIVLLVPDGDDPGGTMFREERVLLQRGEDPRVMRVNGTWCMTFTIPRDHGNFFNGYFVFINEEGYIVDSRGYEIDVRANHVDRYGFPLVVNENGMEEHDPHRVKLGRPYISSKNNYIITISDGRVALFDRVNVDTIPSSIQCYFFKDLRSLLSPPEGYWEKEENTIVQSTILGLDDILTHDDPWNIIGFHTIVERENDGFIIAFIHRGYHVDYTHKIYRWEMVLLRKDTLEPIGVPVPLLDPRDYLINGSEYVKGVFYANGARIIKNEGIDVLEVYLGIGDSFLGKFEVPVDDLISLYWEAQQQYQKSIALSRVNIPAEKISAQVVVAAARSAINSLESCVLTSQ